MRPCEHKISSISQHLPVTEAHLPELEQLRGRGDLGRRGRNNLTYRKYGRDGRSNWGLGRRCDRHRMSGELVERQSSANAYVIVRSLILRVLVNGSELRLPDEVLLCVQLDLPNIAGGYYPRDDVLVLPVVQAEGLLEDGLLRDDGRLRT